MARVTVDLGTDYIEKLQMLADNVDRVSKDAIRAGARVIANSIREKINNLPEDRRTTSRGYWYLTPSQEFDGVPAEQKDALLGGLGISKVKKDKNGGYTAKVGFDGYTSIKTKEHPDGIPIPLLANAIESGSSIRIKQPFVRPAVQKSKKEAEAAMQAVIDAAIENTMK